MSSLELEPLPIAASWARRYTTAVLNVWRLSPETIQAAELAVAEMTTNAIRAAYPAPDPPACPAPGDAVLVTVTLRLLPGRLVIEVTDDDPRPPVPAQPGPEDENGRGLMIVGAIARQWGFRYAPDGGKVTFAVLAIAGGEDTQ